MRESVQQIQYAQQHTSKMRTESGTASIRPKFCREIILLGFSAAPKSTQTSPSESMRETVPTVCAGIAALPPLPNVKPATYNDNVATQIGKKLRTKAKI